MSNFHALNQVFHNPLRPILLQASQSQRLESWTQSFGITRSVVSRFVAGYGVEDALHAATEILRTRYISVDYLGENVTETSQAHSTVAAYLALLEGLGQLRTESSHEIPSDAVEVSLKLSAFGQSLTDGRALALEGASKVCARAESVGALVTVDMEDHTTTDSTLEIVRELRKDFPRTGTVLQSYLTRTEADCRDFAASGSRIRLCKGAYQEPATVAFQNKTDVDESYKRCLEILFAGGGYPMVASHDPQIIAQAQRLGEGRPDDFEYQMLYGIRAEEQERIAATGARMRTYVPYGEQWYGYFTRRLAERPANLIFFLRALFGH